MSLTKKDNIYASSGGDMLYLTSQNAASGGAVSLNKAIYRFVGSTNLGTIVIPNFVPLKPPCLYICNFKLALQSTVSPFNILALEQQITINQGVYGAAIGSNNGAQWIVQSITGNSIAYTKNSVNNTLDVTIVQTIGAGNTVKYILEVEVFAAAEF